MRTLLAALAVLSLLGACRQTPASASADRPQVLFLTSLPVLFDESFSLQAPESPLRDALDERYRLEPIDIADAASLARGRFLLMAQPRAQTAGALVDLDAWVRGGGRLVLLADPLLEWPTKKGLGDPTGPMIAFADTGLLKHWGLTLFRPDAGSSAGSLELLPGADCALADAGVVARCAIGKGRVTVIADADFVRDEAGADQLVEEIEKLRSL